MKKLKFLFLIFLFILFLYLCFMSYTPNITDNKIFDSIEICDFLVSLYDNEYNKEEIKDKTKAFNNSKYIEQYSNDFIEYLKSDRYFMIDDILSYAKYSDDDFIGFSTSLYGKDTELEIIDGKMCIKLSDVVKNEFIVYNGRSYFFNTEDIPTYQNILKSMKYSYVYKDYNIEGNTLYLNYISKIDKDILTYKITFNKLGKIDSIVNLSLTK